MLREGSEHRTLLVDYPSGIETYTRHDDTGEVTHLHTGMTVHYESEDRFEIHPDDPASARMTCRWKKRYGRDDWTAELDTVVAMRAMPDVWRIEARLEARDSDGTVIRREWTEDVPRDHV